MTWILGVLNVGVIIFSLASGMLWIKAAVVKVKAPTTSVGGVLGGGIHVKLESGEVLDFHKTFDLQSKWNSRAAFAAAVAAICAGLSFLSPHF